MDLDLSKKVELNYDPSIFGMINMMRDVQRTLVEQPDFRGIGMHGVEDSPVHGLHSQVSIGMGEKGVNDVTINFRQLEPLPSLSSVELRPTILPKGPDALAPWRW